ncbi:transmembrane protein 53 [Agrilus planipennis]|uniref:Transmembrane protein 53 n=1 Tax=Agrilus planipennis TaxID=224129 RepID=A0A1W4X2A0_AGRPL|nr:transmembrane protein 53 [Agrilus planipennis]
MRVLTTMLFILRNGNSSRKLASKLPKYGLMACIVRSQNFSSVEITKSLELISNDNPKDIKISDMKIAKPQERPMVVLLSWLMAKRKHIGKYAKLYLDQNCDVLNVNINPWQLLWPVKGTQVVAADILAFLDKNPSYAPLMLHGFSVGGYLWGEVLVLIAREPERYQHVLDRIIGQVWDSAADVTEIHIGLPIAVFPRNPVMQSALRKYMLYHLKKFHKVATVHYIRSSQMFHTNLVRSPALFLLSKSDPVGAVDSNQRVRDSWENMGTKVYWKCWEKSPHVGHLQNHPIEYKKELATFLNVISFPSSSAVQKKMEAKA